MSEQRSQRRWMVTLSLGLLLASAALYGLNYLVFRDAQAIIGFLSKYIPLLPLKVFIVTIIIHGLLESREKQERLEKLSTLIGAFFSSIGTDLLFVLARNDPEREEKQKAFAVGVGWTPPDFNRAQRSCGGMEFAVEISGMNLERLRGFLREKNDFVLRLLENPVLLEHERFSDLLRAVHHLHDELIHRDELSRLPASDLRHLAGDIERVYGLLAREWLFYSRHLQKSYPYLFSLVVRLNPFDEDGSPLVRDEVAGGRSAGRSAG